MADTMNTATTAAPPAPAEDVWAAARRRLQENQVWIRLPNMTPNPNVWKEALEFHKKKK